MSLENTLNRFTIKEGFECNGPISGEVIRKMESDLGIEFPEPYCFFLSNYGYIEWFGHTIFGYSDDEDYHTVVRTLELREDDDIPDDFERIPSEGLVLEEYGGGGYYFLFSEESGRRGQVALFLDETYGKESQSWSSFEVFLEYMLSL